MAPGPLPARSLAPPVPKIQSGIGCWAPGLSPECWGRRLQVPWEPRDQGQGARWFLKIFALKALHIHPDPHKLQQHGIERGCEADGAAGLWVFPGLLGKFQEVS